MIGVYFLAFPPTFLFIFRKSYDAAQPSAAQHGIAQQTNKCRNHDAEEVVSSVGVVILNRGRSVRQKIIRQEWSPIRTRQDKT